MDFFRRTGTQKHKFNVDFFIGKMKFSKHIDGQIYVVIKRGDHKVKSEAKHQIDQNNKCNFNKEILSFQALTLFFDQDLQLYQEKTGQLRVILINKIGDKKLLGLVNFDLAQYANSHKQSIEQKKKLENTPKIIQGLIEYQVCIKYIREASQTNKSVSANTEKKNCTKNFYFDQLNYTEHQKNQKNTNLKKKTSKIDQTDQDAKVNIKIKKQKQNNQRKQVSDNKQSTSNNIQSNIKSTNSRNLDVSKRLKKQESSQQSQQEKKQNNSQQEENDRGGQKDKADQISKHFKQKTKIQNNDTINSKSNKKKQKQKQIETTVIQKTNPDNNKQKIKKLQSQCSLLRQKYQKLYKQNQALEVENKAFKKQISRLNEELSQLKLKQNRIEQISENSSYKQEIKLKQQFQKTKDLKQLQPVSKINIIQQQFIKVLKKTAQKKKNQSQINLQSLIIGKFQNSKWSDQLIKQIQKKSQQQIGQQIRQSRDFQQFLIKIISYVYDTATRRVDLVSYFNIICMASKHIKTQTARIISSLTYKDFIIFFINLISQKSKFGKYLTEIRTSIPLFFQCNNRLQYNPKILKSVLGLNNYILILNMGTEKTHKCGKSQLLYSIASLDKKSLKQSSFQNSLNFYSDFCLGIQQKAILADFNGFISKNSSKQLKEKLNIIASKSSLIILHVKQEEIINQKILESQQIVQLLNHTQKIILIIRDYKLAVQKKIKRSIPSNLQKKVWVYLLENLLNSDKEKQIYQFSEFFIKEKLNQFSEAKLNYSSISSEEYSRNYDLILILVKGIVRELYDKQYSKNKILPNLCIQYEISDKKKQLKSIKIGESEARDQKLQKYANIENQIKQLNEKLKQPKLSKFIEKIIKILEDKNKNSIQILIQDITNWKNHNIQPLKRQFIQLTNQLHNCKNGQEEEIKKKIKKNQQKASQYQISIDSIISELVIYNNVKNDSGIGKIIQKYYKDASDNMSPINIIDAKTLKFGNQAIKKLLGDLNKIYQSKRKKIYVISVIGAQSSAKSTLLNFLFRCGFQTSAGRCTKGVYLSVCQVQDIVIVVLDTQGLLSVSARDTAFDNQIATFVLKVSNLIIINNKGQITSTLKDLLKVCMYVLQCLHKDEKKNQYTPQKVIFALRDQTKPKGNFQEEMVAQIKNSLEQVKNSESINYQNFFSIQTDDIFSLPNAFLQIQGISPKFGTCNTFDSVFGKCILALRTKIVNILKKSTPQDSLNSFYSNSYTCWEIIQECGQQILHFKSIHQIFTKKKLSDVLNQKISYYHSFLDKIDKEFFSEIESFNSHQLEQQNIRKRLKHIYQSNKKQITQDFENAVKHQCSNIAWIKDMFPKMFDICQTYYTCAIEQLSQKIQNKKRFQRTSDFQIQINQIVQKMLINGQDNQTILNKLKKLKDDLWNDFNKKVKKLKEDQKNANLNILNSLSDCLASQRQVIQLKVSNVQKCEEKYKELINLMKNQDNRWIDIIYEVNFIKVMAINNKDEKMLSKKTQTFIENFQKQLNNQLIEKKIIKQTDIQLYFQQWQQSIDAAIDALQKSLENQTKNWSWISLSLKRNMIVQTMIGSLFKMLKLQIYQNKLLEIEKEQAIQKALIQKKQEQVRVALKYRGKSAQTLEMWIKKLIQQLGIEMKQKCKQQAQKQILTIKRTLDPQKIILIAMKRSLQQQNGKKKWRQCFKLIANINKYLFEIMCEQQQIVTRYAIVLAKIKEIKESSYKKMEEIIKESSKLNLNNQAQMSNYLKKMKLMYVKNEMFTKDKILKSFFEKIKTDKIKLINEAQSYLSQDQFNKQVDNFIQKQLFYIITGCQNCCPLCGMKCKKPKGHSQGHQVIKNCHLMCAFGGARIRTIQTPCYNICFSKQALQGGWFRQDKQYPNAKQLISANHPDWNNHFPTLKQSLLYQGMQNEVNFCTIWINIQDVLLKNKYKNMKPDHKYRSRFILKDCLNEKDLDIQYENYKGQTVTLRKEYIN